MLEKQTAIVLNSRNFGDSSKIISAFTRQHGKVSLIAKGAKNPKNKFAASISPMSWIEITYYNKPSDNLHLLSSAACVKPFAKIPSSLEHLAVGLMVVESVYSTHSEKHPNEDLFDYTVKILDMLNALPQNCFNLYIAEQFKLAESLGFWLQFDFMIEDEDHPKSRYAFSLEDGCPAAVNRAGNNIFHFSQKTAYAMQEIFRLPIEELTAINIEKTAYNEIVRFFSEYFGFHLEKKFQYKSFSLLAD